MRRGRPSSPRTLSLNKVMSFERVKASTAGFTFSGVVRIMVLIARRSDFKSMSLICNSRQIISAYTCNSFILSSLLD